MTTTRAISRLSRGNGPSVHRYYDVPLEEPGGSRIIYFEFTGAIPGPGQVVVAEADGSEPEVVARCAEAIGHVGGNHMWAGRNAVIFCPALAPRATTVIRALDGSPDRVISGILRSFSHVNHLGITALSDAPADAPRYRHAARMGLWNAVTGEERPLLDIDRAAAIHPLRGRFVTEEMNLMNAKWSPDGTRFFVVFTDEMYSGHAGRPRTVKSLLLADADGGDLRYLGEFTHHPMWTPDSEGIIAHLDRDGKHQDLMRYRLDGSAPEVLIPDYLGVHSALNRAATHVVTDVFSHREPGAMAIRLYEVAGGAFEVLASGPHADVNHVTGSHPHPVWSADESRIFFNAAWSGVPQVYAVSVN